MTPKILIIDDNQAVLNFLKIIILQKGKYDATVLQDSTLAYKTIEEGNYDILLLDMDMPEVTGLDILSHIREKKISITTIVLTGVEDIDLAVSAMKLGTYDYILKPIEEDRLFNAIETALLKRELSGIISGEEYSARFSDSRHADVFKDIVTRDPNMYHIFSLVEKFAGTNNSILIWGESGSGKELIARAIHRISDRRDKKFVAVNAGIFAQELFTSEFFGHEKGAFTGALRDKMGFIEEANEGTLFLDEIGELPLPIQVKLLRVLQEQEFYRVGSTKNIRTDVRIIAATNKNLFEEIKKGAFRKDLFFRLNINAINLPPLRERKCDIPLLAGHFLQMFNEKYGKRIMKISAAVLKMLNAYPFPGNVRELMNIINSAIIVETGEELKKSSLPNYFLNGDTSFNSPDDDSIPVSLAEAEKKHIKAVLAYTSNNHTKAAQILGISRVNLLAKIKKYSI
ncbi:MAG: sigma-54-dependent Fis family transcriptional regulator [Ignavibacteriaceae bacterium]|nr:sigma-54-dependent Fis family transcriptional regulator [Ignavibacteriaceae bacterium]